MDFQKRERRGLVGALVVALALVCCGPGRAGAQNAAADEAYRLRPGDEVAVSVVPQKDYDSTAAILPDGIVRLKGAGAVKAAGLTLSQLQAEVRKLLEKELVDPQVSVQLIRMAPPPAPNPRDLERPAPGKATVVGAVVRSGPIELEPGLRLRKALDLSGGATRDADLTQVIIIHRDLTRTVVDLSTDERVQDPAHNLFLKDGDSVEVRPVRAKPTSYVWIGGQVASPGHYELKPPMSIEDLIVAAGKVSALADLERVELQREGRPAEVVNLAEQLKLGLKGRLRLEAGDEVFIPEHRDAVILVGAIASPGPRALKPGQTVREFLTTSGDAAGALNPVIVDVRNARLMRRGEQERTLDLKEALAKPESRHNVVLRSGDILYLPTRVTERRRSPLDYLQFLGPMGFLVGGLF